MYEDHPQQQISIDNETYMKVWAAEQQYVSTRWNTVTFFMGISFAIIGFSFQSQLTPTEAFAIRIFSLILYWFAYAFYLHFYVYTHFLRSYLTMMENSGYTTHDIQSKAKTAVNSGFNKYLSTRRMLFYFGLIYLSGVILLFLLHL